MVRRLHNLIPLRQLVGGQSARIAQVLGRCDEVHRLEELGLRQGVAIEMVQAGNPCIIRVAGYKLCFRPNETMNVLVESDEVG